MQAHALYALSWYDSGFDKFFLSGTRLRNCRPGGRSLVKGTARTLLPLKMSFLVKSSLLFLLGAQCAYSTALDEYVYAPDDNYKWVDMVRKCW
jgi:hypothetical protein